MAKRRESGRDANSKDRMIGGVPVGYLELVHELSPRGESSRPLKRPRGRVSTGEVKAFEGKQEPHEIKSSITDPAFLDFDDIRNPPVAKVKKLIPDTDSSSSEQSSPSSDSAVSARQAQSESESEDESVNWEEVEIDETMPKVAGIGSESDTGRHSGQTDIVIQLGQESQTGAKQKSKVNHISSAEKHSRKIFHMLDIICILHHVEVRNFWCNDYELRKSYRRLLPSIILQELHAPNHLSDTLKTRKFLDGLRHAIYYWYKKFQVTSFGMKMIAWNEILKTDRVIGNRMSKDRFRSHLLQMRGSRDLCAQGFCALLRSVDIDCRLVCSLQPMDFTSNVPLEPISTREPQYNSYPVFWVEAWDRAGQRWVTADPGEFKFVDIVRGKNKLEPPLSDPNNQMRYVVAFEADGAARDVTRRYASQFNAKTRKKRITVFDYGTVWWDRVLNMFKRWGAPAQRDVMENIELRRRQEKEDMPNNIQDFKNHPIYVLEQHLKITEVLDPKEPCGTLAIRNKQASVAVYRRSCVKTVKSAQNWFRIGRMVKQGMQARKRVPKRKPIRKSLEDDLESDGIDTEPDTAMYSFDQTELYVPPPIVDGMVPKNAFGNIDIYVPSMIPAGGVHLPYPNIKTAAKLISIDCSDAVVGFDFNRRRINPRVEGIVIAKEYQEAVMAVYEELLEEQRQEEERIATARALARWRRYVIALRIKDRLDRAHGVVTEIQSLESSSEHSTCSDVAVIEEKVFSSVRNLVADTEISMTEVMRISDEEDGGGFLQSGDADEGGGFVMPMGEDFGGGFVVEDSAGTVDEINEDTQEPVHEKSRLEVVAAVTDAGSVQTTPIVAVERSESVPGVNSSPVPSSTGSLALATGQEILIVEPPVKDSSSKINLKEHLQDESIVLRLPKNENASTVRFDDSSNITGITESLRDSDNEDSCNTLFSGRAVRTSTLLTDPDSQLSFKVSPKEDELSEDFFPESMSESELLNSE
jgi:xeroderma pigmentosum group C-complementing protein